MQAMTERKTADRHKKPMAATGFGYGFSTLQNPSWTLDQVLLATGGRLAPGGELRNTLLLKAGPGTMSGTNGHISFRSISTDSRTISPGDIFLALSGETFDGLDFVAQAMSRGAAGLIVERPVEPRPAVPVVIVADSLRALGDLAAYRRNLMKKLKVVAITGSSGKTTVKEMTASILGLCGRTLKTQGNFNNLVGLPLSLLPVNYHHDFAVLEMGMNVPGEIWRLTEIADPDVACINNIQPAHLAGLGTVAGVARAKGELFAGCRGSAILAVNLEDPLVRKLVRGSRKEMVRFGFRKEATVRATRITALGQVGTAFTLEVAGQKLRVRLRALGRHNVLNALAAAAMAHAVGASLHLIAAGLEAFAPGDNRFGLRPLARGLRVINDSYNANPSSMAAALATVAMIRKEARTVAVLGDMLELGEFSQQAHAELGAQVAQQGFDYLCALGQYAGAVVEAARKAGMRAKRAQEFKSKDEAAAFIKGLLQAGKLRRDDLVLVKGSRGMRMEQVIAALEEEA